MVGGNGDGTGEGGRSVEDRQLVKVVRPIIWFRLFEHHVETTVCAWIDKKKHEKVIVRIWLCGCCSVVLLGLSWWLLCWIGKNGRSFCSGCLFLW